jgi:hypothetical protein
MDVRECLLSFGSVSVVFHVVVQKLLIYIYRYIELNSFPLFCMGEKPGR